MNKENKDMAATQLRVAAGVLMLMFLASGLEGQERIQAVFLLGAALCLMLAELGERMRAFWSMCWRQHPQIKQALEGWLLRWGAGW